MGYLAYYLLLFGASYALRYPYLLVAVVVVWFGRRWLPDPYLFFKHAGHVRRLKAEIAHNADNVTSRRDLASPYAFSRALDRSAGMSAPSRVFSGADTPSHASHCSRACTSIIAGSEITSSGACRSHARCSRQLPPLKVRRSSG